MTLLVSRAHYIPPESLARVILLNNRPRAALAVCLYIIYRLMFNASSTSPQQAWRATASTSFRVQLTQQRMRNPRYEPIVQWDPEVHQYLSAAFGEEHFNKISKSLCVPPSSTCVRVNTLQASVKEVLDHLTIAMQHYYNEPHPTNPTAPDSVNGIQPQDVHGAASVVPSNVQQTPLVSNQLPYVHPQVPIAVMLPGEGPNNIDYSKAGGAEIIVSRKAGEAALRGAPIYAPGVLACSSGVAAGQLVAVTVAVESPGSSNCGITRGTTLRPQPDGSSEVPVKANKSSPDLALNREHLHIGLGRTMMSRAQMFGAESGIALVLEEPVYRVPSANGLYGKIMLQNLPSVVAAMALKPQPGWRVLDCCAAPGGKTTLIAQLMQDTGSVIALDRTHAKAAEIMSLAQELGLTCVQAYKMDATKALLPNNQTSQQQDSDMILTSAAQESTPVVAVCEGSNAPGADSHDGMLVDKEPNQKLLTRQARKQAARAARGLDPTPRKKRVQEPVQQPLVQQSNTQGTSEQAQPSLSPQADQGGVPHITAKAAPPGFEAESFDAVLMDAPCSALGLRPRMRQTANMAYLKQCAAYTRKLLDVAVQLVRPGGRLVFSTCTINPGENEANVRWILDKYAGKIKLVPAEPYIGGPGLTGTLSASARRSPLVQSEQSKQSSDVVTNSPTQHGACDNAQQVAALDDNRAQHGVQGPGSSNGYTQYEEVWLSEEEAQLVQRFDPAGSQDTIGFFVAAFEKCQTCLH